MTLRLSQARNDPALGYDAPAAARMAASCLQCPSPAPCTRACPRGSDIPRVMRLAGQAACMGLPLSSWLHEADRLESNRIASAICAGYA